MPSPDFRVDAYRKTAHVLVREYPVRLVIMAVVAALIFRVGGLAQAGIWYLAQATLLAVEATLFRTLILKRDARQVGPGVMVTLGLSSLACNVVALFPLAVFMHAGTAPAYFAAAAYMSGLLVNLVVNNGAHPAIFAFASGPAAIFYLGASLVVSANANDPTAALTAAGSVGAGFAAYLAMARNVRGFRLAAAEASREREAAERASATKSLFLAKMSHEIRTPLNAILGMAQAIASDELTAAQKDRLQIIVNAGDELLSMLNAMLDNAQIEAGALTLEPAPVDLADVVVRAAEPFRLTALRKGLAFRVDVSGLEARRLLADGKRIERCVAHLVSNSVKFTAKGEVCVVAASRRYGDRQATVEIAVRDTGVGMTEEQAARAFEPFEQGDNSIRRRYGGAGLGLSVARSVMRAMGGDIVARCTQDAGSTFTLRARLPLADDDARLAAPDAPSGERPSVLVVEDNLVNFQVVRAMLQKHARAVAHAENGAEALDRLHQERFDLILMDMHMPVMDGLAATREIRAAGKDWSRTPIVFVTAATSAEDEGAAFANGANGFLPKPVKADALARALGLAAPVRRTA